MIVVAVAASRITVHRRCQIMFWENLGGYWDDIVEWMPALILMLNIVLATTTLAWVVVASTMLSMRISAGIHSTMSSQ